MKSNHTQELQAMAGLDEKKELAVQLESNAVDVAIEFNILTRFDAYVWLKGENDEKWTQIDAVRNASKRVRLGQSKDLKGGKALLVFDLFGDAASGATRYSVSGHLEASGSRDTIVDSSHRFTGSFDGDLRIVAIEWSLS
jgi:hypothetical protein